MSEEEAKRGDWNPAWPLASKIFPDRRGNRVFTYPIRPHTIPHVIPQQCNNHCQLQLQISPLPVVAPGARLNRLNMTERRLHPRYPARWRVTIYCHCHRDMQQKTFDGLSSDVSLGGMCVHSHHNLCSSREMDLVLLIPPLHVGGEPHKLRIRAKASHTVLVGEVDAFRTGIQFVGMSDADRECLHHHLETRFGFYALGGSAPVESATAA